MSKIIVGVDLSPESERGIAHAIGIGRHLDAEVMLVLVTSVPDAAIEPAEAAALARFDRAEILASERRGLAALRQRWIHHGVEVSQLVVDGRAAERLPTLATELDATLLVVGSHGRTGLKRFLIGSVAERVARHADRSVLVARGTAPDGGYHRVILGTDFEPQLEASVQRTLPYIARHGRLELVHCWQLPAAAYGEAAIVVPYADVERAHREALEVGLERVRAILHDRPDLTLVSNLLPAPPASGIVEAADAFGADLVAVGSHGRRGVRRLVLGSVAEVVLRHAGCSVLVAR